MVVVAGVEALHAALGRIEYVGRHDHRRDPVAGLTVEGDVVRPGKFCHAGNRRKSGQSAALPLLRRLDTIFRCLSLSLMGCARASMPTYTTLSVVSCTPASNGSRSSS